MSELKPLEVMCVLVVDWVRVLPMIKPGGARVAVPDFAGRRFHTVTLFCLVECLWGFQGSEPAGLVNLETGNQVETDETG